MRLNSAAVCKLLRRHPDLAGTQQTRAIPVIAICSTPTAPWSVRPQIFAGAALCARKSILSLFASCFIPGHPSRLRPAVPRPGSPPRLKAVPPLGPARLPRSPFRAPSAGDHAQALESAFHPGTASRQLHQLGQVP